jgi:membrane protein implicated in regulation of membrane protease activity
MSSMGAWKKYALFQLPGCVGAAIVLLGLVEWFSLPPWLALGLFSLWVLKDIALYSIVRSAYESDVKTGVERLVGEIAVAQERLDPHGTVRVRGELWQAAAEPTEQPIEPKSEVRIIAATGLTLTVSRKSVSQRA